ncbi:unnamed protein product [Lathyrus sativus]|nr:unnamed protein product [Lathyrus sativus]
MEECFWKEKSRTIWNLEGDRNTAFFHRVSKIKSKLKPISMFKHDDAVLLDSKAIADCTVNYFKNLFSTNTSVLQDMSMVDDTIPRLVDNNMNVNLTQLPSLEEIYAAVFVLNKDSAPGPDGFGATFFQLFWNIVKGDVSNPVTDFFINGWILPSYNSNSIVLIPKVKGVDDLDSLRPIALSNFKFKLISKIIVDRLATLMPFLVSEEQCGFS